ncbi:kinesin-like protein KIF12 [Centruroides vittatus]|uniref:kinesin-like protein KIF12 n=1 Tax=Centruroides vittatus TaxID=120091 RepID=UPI00350EAA32
MSVSQPSTAASEEIYDDDSKDEETSIKVVVRVRPLMNHDKGVNVQAVQFPGAGQIMMVDQTANQSHIFTYNVVFEPEASQEDVFEFCGIKKMIDMALDGFSCTVFAYGQTGAGKTYTLTGCNDVENNSLKQQEPGIVQMSFIYLFNQIKLRTGLDYVVQASYLEIYREQVLDLLNPSDKALSVRWSKERGFYAENLFVVECEDLGDLEGVLEEGQKNRQVRSHMMNEHSSRSHAMLALMLTSEICDPDDPTNFIRRHGKLSLVDLAGSEKTKKTNSQGDVLKEANNINKSLLVLGNCISALSDPKKRNGHIPYRDSTLTKLLADSMSGSGMALMIACVSPHKSNVPETLNTLRYASRAKRIKTKPVIIMDPREQLILSLKREVKLLRMENNYLRSQVNLNQDLFNKPFIHNGLSLKDIKDEDIRTMLQKYMQENEILRAENSQLHEMKELLTRDHELACRENDKLSRKLAEMESAAFLDSTLAALSNSGSWKSLVNLEKELEKVSNDMPETESPKTSNSRPITQSTKIIGKSLRELNRTPEERKSRNKQRRNSWSGIPVPIDKSSRNANTSSSHSSKSQPDLVLSANRNLSASQKLPPLKSETARSKKKNTRKSAREQTDS